MRRMLCSLLVVGSVTVSNAAQQPDTKRVVRPDFSGAWTSAAIYEAHIPVIEGRANRPDSQLQIGGPAHTLVISQGADKLRIEERRTGPSVNLVIVEYGLNGQPAKSQFLIEPLRPAAPAEATSKWEESKLVSTIDVVVPGEADPRHYIQTLSISPEGILAVRIQRVGTADSLTMFYKKAN